MPAAEIADVPAAAAPDTASAGEEPVEAPVVEVETATAVAVEAPAAAAVEPAPVPEEAPVAPPAPAQPDESTGFSAICGSCGAIVLAVLGIFYIRRRGSDAAEDDVPVAVPAPARDVFADVELTDQALEVEDAVEPPALDEEPRKRVPNRASRTAVTDSASTTSTSLTRAAMRSPKPKSISPTGATPGYRPAQECAGQRSRQRGLPAQTGCSSTWRRAIVPPLSSSSAELESPVMPTAWPPRTANGCRQLQRRGRLRNRGDRDDAGLLAEFDGELESDFGGLEIEEPALESLDDELDLSADFDDADLAGMTWTATWSLPPKATACPPN